MKLTIPKTAFFVLALILIIWGGFYFFKNKNKSNEQTNLVTSKVFASTADLSKLAEQDSDQDGIVDWEEALWKTDPKNKDTDLDSTSDGDEIKANRNPLKAGPDDSLENADEATPGDNEIPTTATEEFARGTFAAYLMGDQSAGSEIVASALESSVITLYTASDIKISGSVGEEGTLKYGEELGKAIAPYTYHTTQDELGVFRSLLESQSEKDAEQLRSLAIVYRLITESMLLVEVPNSPSLIQFHLNIANSYYGMYQSILQMANIAEDPIAAMVALKRASGYNKNIVDLYQKVNQTSKSL